MQVLFAAGPEAQGEESGLIQLHPNGRGLTKSLESVVRSQGCCLLNKQSQANLLLLLSLLFSPSSYQIYLQINSFPKYSSGDRYSYQ